MLIVTPVEHPIGPAKFGYRIWSDINVDYKIKQDRNFLSLNHLGLTYLLPITENHPMFVSTCVKLTPDPNIKNQLMFILY